MKLFARLVNFES